MFFYDSERQVWELSLKVSTEGHFYREFFRVPTPVDVFIFPSLTELGKAHASAAASFIAG